MNAENKPAVGGHRRAEKWSIFARGSIVILSVALATILIRKTGLDGGLDELKAWADTEIRGRGIAGSAAFVAAGVLITALGLSRQVVAFIGGYAFGVSLGTGLTLMATVASCALTFSYARFLGRGPVMNRYSRKIARLNQFLKSEPFLVTLAVRMLPVGNNLVVNLVAGVTSVPAAAFVAASAIGYVPQTVVFALMGSGLAHGALVKTVVAILLFAASSLLSVYLYRRYRLESALDGNGGSDISAAAGGNEATGGPRAEPEGKNTSGG